MKRVTKALSLTILGGLGACSPSIQVTEAGVREIREEVVASRATFEQTAALLVPSGIIWADRVSVRYQLGSDYRTENWDSAQLAATIKADLTNFMTTRNVQAVFVHEQRVNFVLRSGGIAPSGVSIGVVVAPAQQHSCTAFSAPLRLDAQGLQCEKLDVRTYLYLQR